MKYKRPKRICKLPRSATTTYWDVIVLGYVFIVSGIMSQAAVTVIVSMGIWKTWLSFLGTLATYLTKTYLFLHFFGALLLVAAMIGYFGLCYWVTWRVVLESTVWVRWGYYRRRGGEPSLFDQYLADPRRYKDIAFPPNHRKAPRIPKNDRFP